MGDTVKGIDYTGFKAGDLGSNPRGPTITIVGHLVSWPLKPVTNKKWKAIQWVQVPCRLEKAITI